MNLANFVDLSGNGRNLILGGSTAPTFDSDPWGIGQPGVVLSNTVTLTGTGSQWPLPSGDFTVRFRFRRTAGHNGVQQIICGRWGYIDGAFAYQWLVYINASNQLVFILSATLNASSTSILTGSTITDTSAHAVEVSRSGGNLSMYIDGTRVVGPVGSFTQVTVPDELPFMVGNYDDSAAGTAFYPFWGTLGEFELASAARHTGASYTVSTTPLAADASTVALLPLSFVTGNYITPAYVGNILLRGSFTPASGGWANPDGPLQAIDGSWYFTASAYNSSVGWTCWAITASTLSALLAGSGTIGSAAIQTPSTGEGGLAANGSVVAFGGTYWHYYHDQGSPVSLRYSSGSNLGAAFSPQPGNVLWAGYFDPMVRVSDDGSQLIMLMCKEEGSGRRSVWRSTSSNGSTWSSPTKLMTRMSQAGFNAANGEFAFDNIAGSHKFGMCDGAPEGTTTRRVTRWATLDGGTNWLPLGELFNASGTGSDASSAAYVTCYDASPFYDSASNTYYILATHSTNTAPVSPTNSDIGLWSSTFSTFSSAVTGAGGTASAEGHGSTTVTVTLTGSVTSAGATASAEAHGSSAVSYMWVVAAAGGAATSEAHGTPVITVSGGAVILDAGGTASAEAHGTASASYVWAIAGAGAIASGMAHGTPTVSSDGEVVLEIIASSGTYRIGSAIGSPITMRIGARVS